MRDGAVERERGSECSVLQTKAAAAMEALKDLVLSLEACHRGKEIVSTCAKFDISP